MVGCTRVPDQATSATLDEELARCAALVDEWTRAALADNISPQAERLRAMLEYHLGWRDKHLQPLTVSAPEGTILNVNIPPGEIRGSRLTHQGVMNARTAIIEEETTADG